MATPGQEHPSASWPITEPCFITTAPDPLPGVAQLPSTGADTRVAAARRPPQTPRGATGHLAQVKRQVARYSKDLVAHPEPDSGSPESKATFF